MNMKTMKLWRLAFAMLAAFSLASCSSDDDTDTYEATELSGTWQKVYDEGIADAGIVQYTFHPQSANNGTVDIFTSDWATGPSPRTARCTSGGQGVYGRETEAVELGGTCP